MKASLFTTLLILILSLTCSYGQQETLIKRINCGGNQVTGADGLVYDADTSNSDVSFSSFSSSLTHLSYVSPELSEPYLKSRLLNRNGNHGEIDFNYTFNNLSDMHQYRIILHFAEPYHGVINTNWNTRIFDIDINNGQYVFDDYNIMTEAALPSTNPMDGAKKVAKINRVVNISGGSLVIKFTNQDNDALVNAIELFRIENGGDNQAPTIPTNLVVTNITENSADIAWSASSDNGGGNVAGYKVYNNGIEIKDVITTTTTIAGLNEQTQYNISVAAYDNASPVNISSVSAPTINFTTLSSGGSTSNGSSIWSEVNTTASYSGEVAIGRATVPNGYKLAIEGHVRAREVRVDQETWPDYVFKEGYDLPTLEEIQEHIDEKGHLPNIPSANEVMANGIELGEMNRLLLEKIEELTLHVLQLKNEIEYLKSKQ